MSDVALREEMFTPEVVGGIVTDYKELHRHCTNDHCDHDYAHDPEFQRFMTTLERCPEVLGLIQAVAATALEQMIETKQMAPIPAAITWGIIEGWRCAMRALEVEALKGMYKDAI